MGVRASKLKVIFFESNGVGRRRLSLSEAPSTRRGYVPVCVGVDNETSKRFMVHTTSLGTQEFADFLCMSAEEYGFCNQGVLRIPYEAKDFEDWMVRRARRNALLYACYPNEQSSCLIQILV
ncbi:hypothetical protein Scep_025030 [Stephania cephalantha]|uniref:Uncharacterized protein n=1 Tax=Stephania cephalantha TaxID=152367 RepID=A0AAP0F0F5_9MAGN